MAPPIAGSDQAAREIRRRMLVWPNPVDFVNNMYGCHPGEDGDYFDVVFGGATPQAAKRSRTAGRAPSHRNPRTWISTFVRGPRPSAKNLTPAHTG